MPKSRRSHKKIPQIKKKQIMPVSPPAVASQSVAQTDKSSATSKPVSALTAASYATGNPYVVKELKRISIVTGVIIVILIVLVFVLG